MLLDLRQRAKPSRLGIRCSAQMRIFFYTASLARPLARRARITARPPRVFMRTKNPCVRFLLITEGWYVRFI